MLTLLEHLVQASFLFGVGTAFPLGIVPGPKKKRSYEIFITEFYCTSFKK